jgi:hypothetical protein
MKWRRFVEEEDEGEEVLSPTLEWSDQKLHLLTFVALLNPSLFYPTTRS